MFSHVCFDFYLNHKLNLVFFYKVSLESLHNSMRIMGFSMSLLLHLSCDFLRNSEVTLARPF